MTGLENFWNSWATNRKDILLIGCGSAASWMINQLINNTGGLHNRITSRIKLHPFTLKETDQFLKAKNCQLGNFQTIQLYMAMGGLPYYLESIERGKSATQMIDQLFFTNSGMLRYEFNNLYRSLYKHHENYEKVVEVLASKTKGMQRNDILEKTGLSSGGTFTRILQDLEESGFIRSYSSLDNKVKHTFYRLSDYYTAFYFRFIKNNNLSGEGTWIKMADHPSFRSWQGYTFEQVCLDHILEVKKAIGISAVLTRESAWRGSHEGEGAQIDMVIQRRDNTTNICEMKFSTGIFTITKAYAVNLRKKITVFKNNNKTKDAIHLVMITTFGITNNSYAQELVQNNITIEALFNN